MAALLHIDSAITGQKRKKPTNKTRQTMRVGGLGGWGGEKRKRRTNREMDKVFLSPGGLGVWKNNSFSNTMCRSNQKPPFSIQGAARRRAAAAEKYSLHRSPPARLGGGQSAAQLAGTISRMSAGPSSSQINIASPSSVR